MSATLCDVRPAVAAALAARRAVVALESTLVAHGLPWPTNLEVARDSERAVRAGGAVPATIAVLDGSPTVGLTDDEIVRLAQARGVRKASARDLAAALAQKATAATTVSATMRLAHDAGIRVFATGGIGGVHPTETGQAFDVSAALTGLARRPRWVVCAGAKSILDLPATLEVLETNGVPVVGWQTDTFPAFYLPSSGLSVSARVETPAEAAALLRAHWRLGGAGVVLARPLPEEAAVDPNAFAIALGAGGEAGRQTGVAGAPLTPSLLARQ